MSPSPSAAAMDAFVAASPGLRCARLVVPDPSLPTLPDLKKLARDRRDAGHAVIDQSAGDIADVGAPLAPGFRDHVEEARDALVAQGCSELARTSGDAYGYPGHYQQQYPAVLAQLALGFGVHTPTRAFHTISGRTALDLVLRGLRERAPTGGRPALLLDPLAWSGYGPLARGLGLELVSAPAVRGNGLATSAEGLTEALALCEREGLQPVATVPILPSNPTGVGMSGDALAAYVQTAAAAGLPVLIDAFYAPLHPDGHRAAVPLEHLQQVLPPEVLAWVGVLVGETKVTSSQNKTGSVFWLAPAGHEATAQAIVGPALSRMKATNCYPRPQEAVVAYALHTFPGGVHAAMGPRYTALDAARQAMLAAADRTGLPLSIGGSFYGTVALVGPDGQGLVRDAEGRPLTRPADVSRALIERFGLVGAPGGMFSSAPEAGVLVRLTAAVTLADVKRLEQILAQMLAEAA